MLLFGLTNCLHDNRDYIMKPSIKTLTLKTLLTVILFSALLMTILIGVSFRVLSKEIIINQAIATSELIKAGLTSHMKTGMMDKRSYFLSEISSIHHINSIRIIRSEEINRQYGERTKLEGKGDSFSAEVFRTKEPIFMLNEFTFAPNIRALIPFIALKEGKLNCMDCHKVQEGTVLGVVDIELDIISYRKLATTILAILLFISFILVLLIIANTFRTVDRYIQAPLESLISKAQEAYKKQEPVDSEKFSTLEFQTVAEEINLFNADIIKTQNLLKNKNQELINLNDEIEETLRETVFTMGVIEEQRSKETKNHTRRVTEYCRLIASRLGYLQNEVDIISAASPLHDIGKIGISDYILLKSDKLTKEEFEIMKNHTSIGYKMLIHSQRSILKAAAIISSQHHERWDGTGYPQGLKGEEIHIYGRIAALADVYDALSTARPYKKAWMQEKVLDEIKAERGRHFDPNLVDILLENIDEFAQIRETYKTD